VHVRYSKNVAIISVLATIIIVGLVLREIESRKTQAEAAAAEYPFPPVFQGMKEGDVVEIAMNGVLSGSEIPETPVSATMYIVLRRDFTMGGRWKDGIREGSAYMLYSSDDTVTVVLIGFVESLVHGIDRWNGKIVREGKAFRMMNPRDAVVDAEKIEIDGLPDAMDLYEDYVYAEFGTLGTMNLSLRKNGDKFLFSGTCAKPKQRSGTVRGVIQKSATRGVFLRCLFTNESEQWYVTGEIRKNSDGKYVLIESMWRFSKDVVAGFLKELSTYE